MKNQSIKLLLVSKLTIVLTLIFISMIFAQQHEGNFDPDSLTQVTLSGTTMVDSSYMNRMYYLDENTDGVADYKLNFGPYWYEPSEGNGKRPSNGEVITISGGLHHMNDNLSVVVVYEIKGDFWRDPYEPIWDNMGHHSHEDGHHQGDCQGYTFGFAHDSLSMINLTGTTIVDSTFIFGSYFLDTNSDSIPDYYLNFGPPWYEPNSNVQKPRNGDEISIVGGLIHNDSIPMIIVYSLNGFNWRDSNSIGSHLGGGWAHKNMTDSLYIYSTFDDKDWMSVKPGWYNGGGMHGGGMMTDSLFFQMMEVFPQDIPFIENENVFAGYEMGVFLPDGSNNMWNGGGCGGMMNFNSMTTFNLHFTDRQTKEFNASPENIKAKYWDSGTSSWKEIPNVAIDLNNGTVNFSLSSVSNYLILTSSFITAVEEENSSPLINDFELKQNYPNPFNPSSIIEYQLPSSGFVSLKVYDVLGKEVAALVNQEQTAGIYQVNFDGSNLASGIYFYKLKSGNFLQIKKMMMLK